MIEAPTALQAPGALTIPADHYDACAKQNVPVVGNAAGNTKDLFDLTGANESVPPLPEGFTARGIVALVFSCLSGILGVAVIAWYGVGEIGKKEEVKIEGRIDAVTVAVAGEGETREI